MAMNMRERLLEIKGLLDFVWKMNGNDFDNFRMRESGPFWPVLRRYVELYKAAKELSEYVDELEGIIEAEDIRREVQL